MSASGVEELDSQDSHASRLRRRPLAAVLGLIGAMIVMILSLAVLIGG